MDDFTDLVWGRIFSQTSLEIFPPTYNGVRFFFSVLYIMSNIFSVQDIYFPGIIYLHAFILSKSV